jgi:hypothetical protein
VSNRAYDAETIELALAAAEEKPQLKNTRLW